MSGRYWLAVALVASLVPCPGSIADFPRDPDKTLQRLQGGRIRIGVVENSPWSIKSGESATGVEAELIKRLAAQLNATPEWHWGGEEAHMQALERHELDVVIGGITKKTPWKDQIGATDTYYQNHIIA